MKQNSLVEKDLRPHARGENMVHGPKKNFLPSPHLLCPQYAYFCF
jgi:hypothetical protein